MISTSEFKNGIAILLDGLSEIFTIENFQHVKPGKGGAFVRTTLRGLKTGKVLERTFRSGEKVQEAFIDERKLQFLYRAGDTFHFMDMKTYEETQHPAELLGEGAGFLKEGMEVTSVSHNGDVLSVNVPTFVELKVESSEPGIRGDTAKSGTKPAKLETGKVIQVPLFIEPGTVIRIDTRTAGYVSRV